MKIKLVLILAILLRFLFIDSIPSLNPDEAALGYNAYSLLQTGKDEHGSTFPLHFKSFGDYKPGGYVYLAMPFIKILGLTPFAVRLPNLILSVLTIYIVYKLVLLLTSNLQLSTLSAFVLAVNPWHIHFSRGAWESSVALFFIVLGIYWFYSYIILHKSKYLFLFPLAFVASLYIYHSARIITPLLVGTLLLTNYKTLLPKINRLVLPALLAILLTIPVFLSFLNNGGTTRFGGVGIFADKGPLSRSEELLNQHPQFNLIDRIEHNQRLLYILSWGQKYFSHFDFNFLFIKGDEVPRSKSPDMGQLYLFELPLLLFGIYQFIRSKLFQAKSRLFFTIFFLVAPLASSLTFQAPSALRSLSLTIPLSIFVAFGIYKLINLKNIFVSWLLFLGYFLSLSYILDSYFIHAPKRYPFAWNSKFEEVVPYLNLQKENYKNIYFTNKYDQPYILYLFYSKYDPSKIQSQIQLTPPDKFGFSTVLNIDNIYFQVPPFDDIPQNSLIIASDESIPNDLIKTIDFTNGSNAFKIYTK